VVSFEQFYRAIAQQESGNNYKAVGVPTKWGRAYGKYQVLEPNIGPWTQRYFGQRLTAQQFLNNPRAQEAVARGELQRLFKAHGARGAASAWYSGNPSLHMSTRSQAGGPSIKGYVDSVLRIASGISSVVAKGASVALSSGVGGSSGGGSFSMGAVTPMTLSEQAESYGLSLRLVNSNKELKSLFDKAVKGSWSGSRFQAALKNTKWWRTQSSDLRKYITLKITDPATWRQERSSAHFSVQQLATAVGLGKLSNSLKNEAIYNKLALGWSDARLKAWMGTKVKLSKDGGMMGEAGEVFDALHTMAYQLGLTLSQSWYRDKARSVVSGKSTLQQWENTLRQRSAAIYTAWSAQIKAGMSIQDLAAPYTGTVARLLELPESDVDVWNSHVAKAMKAKGDKQGAQYPLWQLERDVRSDVQWRKTNNARETMMTTARQIGQDFGVAW
jgi:hypothetical protein